MKYLNQILQGDALVKLKELPDEIVNCCVTSPPYWGLRDYGTAKWEGGDENCEHWIKGDGGSPGEKQKTNTGSLRKAKDVCPKCGAVRIDNQLGLEKTPEEYVEKLVAIFREVKRVLKKDGTLWLNLGDSYAAGGRGRNEKNDSFLGKGQGKAMSLGYKKPPKGLKQKDLVGIPWRVAFALQADGWYLRSDIIWHKPNPMPESVTDRPTKSHEYVFLLSKSKKYYYNADAIREPHIWGEKDKRADGNRHQTKGKYESAVSFHPNGRNKRSVWTVNTKPYSDAHFATFPEKLIIDMIKAGCPEEGIVLDPFMGAGTTALVAKKLNRNYIGIELNKEYIDIANKRLYKELGMFL